MVGWDRPKEVQHQAPGSAGQALGLLGMLGGVPSHVSVAASAASASLVPSSGYFETQKCQAFEINACQVTCPKHACGAHGSRDYACHQEAAAKALSYPFASTKHFHAKNAEGEASNKYANLQSENTGNFAKIKTLQEDRPPTSFSCHVEVIWQSNSHQSQTSPQGNI